MGISRVRAQSRKSSATWQQGGWVVWAAGREGRRSQDPA